MIKDLFFIQILTVKKERELKNNSKSFNVFSLEKFKKTSKSILEVEEVSERKLMIIIIQDHIKIKLEHGHHLNQNFLEKRETFIKKIKEFEKKYPIKISSKTTTLVRLESSAK